MKGESSPPIRTLTCGDAHHRWPRRLARGLLANTLLTRRFALRHVQRLSPGQCCGLIVSRQGVGISGQCHGDAGMSEALAHYPQGDGGPQQGGGMAMPESVPSSSRG